MITLSEARANIGNAVVYRPANGPQTGEEGVITSVNDDYVFVRYGAETGAKATMPRDLTFAVAPMVLIRVWSRAEFTTPGRPFSRSMRCTVRCYGQRVTVAEWWFGIEVVMFTELNDNPGASVTNCSEDIAPQAAKGLGIARLDQVAWVEHYPRAMPEPDTFDRIRYGGDDLQPQWSHLGPDGFRRLLRLPEGAEIPL